MKTGPKPRPLSERFMEKVVVDRASGCWLWQGQIMPNGYGRFYFVKKQVYAHRAAYELFVGEIPAGMEVDHVKAVGCQHRHCVNPEHLEAVSHRENNARSDSPSAVAARQDRCQRGHEFIIERASGKRRCKVCHNAARRARSASARNTGAGFL